MPIQVVCPTCEKSYKVKDEAAGKKMRCKGCETVIPIPVAAAVEEGDPWDALPEAGEEGEATPQLPPVQRKKKPQPTSKRSRASAGDGMPATVIVSIVICGLIAVGAVVGIVFNLMQSNVPGAGGVLLRLGITCSIINGLRSRKNYSRWAAIILDAIGLAFVFFCVGGGLLLFHQQVSQNVPADAITFLVALFGSQAVLWIVDIAVLLSPSARDYCNE